MTRIRAELQKKQGSLDLAKRVSMLETHVSEAAVVIEALIQLLEERVGLPREEVLARLADLKVDANPPEPLQPTVVESSSLMPIEPKPLRLAPSDEKDPFEPRRKWRDARSRV